MPNFPLLDHRTLPIYLTVVLSALGLIFNIISFFSFNWIELSPEYKSYGFERIGLWVACFKNYIHPEDYVSKNYYGCYFIYWREYRYIRDWLTPSWFITVQVFASLSIICNAVTLAIVLAKFLSIFSREEYKLDIIAIICQGFATFFIVFDLIYVGVMSKDRNWLPRPDHNRVGWSFAMHIIAGFCTIYDFIFLCMLYCMLFYKEGIPWWDKLLEQKLHLAVPRPGRPSVRDPPLDETHSMPGGASMSLFSNPNSARGASLGPGGAGGSVVSAAAASAYNRDALDRKLLSSGGGGARPAASYGKLPGVGLLTGGAGSRDNLSGAPLMSGPILSDSAV